MTVKVADVHAYVQRLVSVVRMVTVLDDCTTEEKGFLGGGTGLDAKDIYKEIVSSLWWEVFVG
jgi:hypothetical protein